MASIYGTALMSGVGGVNENLPPMVTDLRAAALNTQINLSWKNPISEYLFGILITYNTDHIPTKPTDGTQTKVGKVESATLTGLVNDTKHYIRLFPFNEKGQYQTLVDGSFVEATPAVGPAKVTDFQVTGSGANPVLTWKNPTSDPLYHTTVVIQKEGSVPSGLSDGTEIFRGTNETCTARDLKQSTDYYFAVFTLSAEGGTRGGVNSEVYRFDFPEEPTGYLNCVEIPSTTEYEIPEDGWFRIDAIGKCGNGGSPATSETSDGYGMATCGGGGCGGHARSEVPLHKGDKLSITITNEKTSVVFNGNNIIANSGKNGGAAGSKGSSAGIGGTGGTSLGGNKLNNPGANGAYGQKLSGTPFEKDIYGGDGGRNTIEINRDTTITINGGRGAGGYRPYKGSMKHLPATNGSVAKVYISRGNTNNPSPSQASELSLIPKNTSMEVNWEDSGDPVQTGTTLVYSTEHVPTSPTDGTAINVPIAKAKSTENKQSQTLSGLENGKPVFVSLFPYDKDKNYGIAKSDVEIPKTTTWYDKQQELEAKLVKAQTEVVDYKAYYDRTQEVLK